MKSNSTPQPAREKKPYNKPEIEKVSLVMGESVLATACKIGGDIGGPGGNDCTGPVGGWCVSPPI